MTVSAPYFLDGPLWHLGRDLGEGVLDLLSLRVDGGRAALLFRSEAGAAAHLPRLPEGYRVRAVPAGDWRAKEELLRAALALGAEALFLDATVGGLEPAERRTTRRALDYVLSQRREAACL